VALSEKGAIFFHCHPAPPKWLDDDWQTKLSMGDNLAVPYSRREVIFCPMGVVLGLASQQYSYEETDKIFKQMREVASNSLDLGQFEDDAGPIFVGLIRERFKIKSFVVDKKVMQYHS
jgi:hypothetical protein